MVVHTCNPQLLRRLRPEKCLNLGGGGCTELRSYHCTPAWVTEQDSISKKKKPHTRVIFPGDLPKVTPTLWAPQWICCSLCQDSLGLQGLAMAEAFPVTGISHAWPSRQQRKNWINSKLEITNNKLLSVFIWNYLSKSFFSFLTTVKLIIRDIQGHSKCA